MPGPKREQTLQERAPKWASPRALLDRDADRAAVVERFGQRHDRFILPSTPLKPTTYRSAIR